MDVLDIDLGHRLVPYDEAWSAQRTHHQARVSGERGDALMLLEHASVYTAGKRTASWDRPTDGTPVVDVDRGGRITWHGPGQLVGYPIVRLREPVDVVGYVRALEDAIIALCANYGVDAVRVPDRTGVWLPADDRQRMRKICALGVRVAKGVTMHGFALNCNPDLEAFSSIVPCGITDADVTSLSAELGRTVTVTEVAKQVPEFLERALSHVRWETVAVDHKESA